MLDIKFWTFKAGSESKGRKEKARSLFCETEQLADTLRTYLANFQGRSDNV